MKRILIALAIISTPAAAQTKWFNAQLEMRADYTVQKIQDADANKGFKGRYLNMKLSGDINEKFSYAYRQRFSKDISSMSGFLNATDFLYLSYHPNSRWNITAGKQFVWIGGFEYDYAPIDVYQYTEYCNNINCYGYGLSADCNVTEHDNILIQAAQSAFAGHDKDYYSFNAKWTGHHGCFTGIYSLNFQEYDRHKYLNVIALGNRFDFKKGHLIADYTHRGGMSGGSKFFGDFSVLSELHVQPIKELNVIGHYSYDQNKNNVGDCTVLPGTKIHTLGIGFEAFPYKGDQDIRLHASYFHNWGTNTNPNGTLLVFDNQPQSHENYVTVGLTFRINWLKIKEQLAAKRK